MDRCSETEYGGENFADQDGIFFLVDGFRV